MKVCHVVSTFPRSEDDPEVPWLAELLKQLREQNIEVKVFSPAYKGLKDHEISGIPVKRFRYFFKRFETLTHEEGATNKMRNPIYWPLPLFYLFFGAITFLKFCKEEGFDLIHVHWPMPHAIFGYLAKKIQKIPFVSTFYTAEIVLTNRVKPLKILLRKLLRHSAKIIAISSYTKSELQKITGLNSSVIPYGSTFPPVEKTRSPKKTSDKWRLLFVGRLIERKGLNYLLQAIPLLMDNYDVKLHIVGSGNQSSHLQDLARQLGITDNVIFEGKVPNSRLKELYKKCDIFVLPSIVDSRGETEGLGVVLLEALSYRMPVVASDVGGITDVIKYGKTGYLAKQKDPRSLADKIMTVIENHEESLRISEAGLKFSNNYFNWDRITNEINTIYSNTVH
ncbi:MAG: glycosyltransferase family 4 protein [Actinobacteria bacterium]|nr:glycosyltransferase family 4 protein [Actinomycetota bacterium]